MITLILAISSLSFIIAVIATDDARFLIPAVILFIIGYIIGIVKDDIAIGYGVRDCESIHDHHS